MNVIKSFLPFAFSQTPEEFINATLSKFQITSSIILPQKYETILFPNTYDFHQLLASVIKCARKATNAFALIKIFTIILKAIKDKKYQKQTLELLEQFQLPSMPDFDSKEHSWIYQLAIAIKSYLVRLPSMHDVFERALTFKNQKDKKNGVVSLSDLYRLLNVYGLLFPGLTNSLNIIGRYYLSSSAYFIEFYKIVKDEVNLGYEYVEGIVSFFKSQYKDCQVSTINCFLKTIPAIELYCDKLEEFMMNKYFKGRGPNKKIYFKEDQFNEITYYIQSLKQKDGKSEESMHQTDEEDFGNFQKSINI